MTDRTKITLADMNASGETEGDSLVITDAGDITASGVTGGSATFLDLTDAPDSYSGQGDKVVSVNTGATALEFTDAGLTVQEDDSPVAVGVTVLNFEGGAEVTDEGSGKATVVISGGAGGGEADCSVWMPDAPPATAYSSGGVDDDEFDDESFDTGIWTVYDAGSRQTETEAEYGLNLSQSGTDFFQGVFQPIPSGSDWSITTFVGHNHYQTGNGVAGILLLSDIGNLNTSDVFIWGVYRGGSGFGWRWAKATAYSGTGYSDGSWINDSRDIGWYVRLRASGTTWYFDWSLDGYTWIAHAYTQAREWVPEGVGVGYRVDNTAWSINFKFARFKDDSAHDQMLHGDRVNMWRTT